MLRIPRSLSFASASPRNSFRNYVQKVLEKVLHEVRNNRRFDSLQEEINNIAKRQEGERNLEVNAQIWHSQAEQLRQLLESDKKANEEETKKMMILVQESDAQVDQAILVNNAKLGKRTGHLNATLDIPSSIIAVALRLRGKVGKGETGATGPQTEAAKDGYTERTERLYEGIQRGTDRLGGDDRLLGNRHQG